jgi:hypothetical protein
MQTNDYPEGAPLIPQPASADKVYGSVVYWCSVIACLVCTIAPILTVARPENNSQNPYMVFSRIWAHQPPEALWETSASPLTDVWYWIHHVTFGDGLMMFGLFLGCSCASIALLCCSAIFLFGKHREPVWGVCSLSIAAAMILALTGVLM